MAPELASIVTPAGGETRLNVKVLVGMSGSVADAATLSGVSSLRVCGPGTLNEGATLISLTMTMKLLVRVNAVPFFTSVTLTVNVFVLGPVVSSVGQEIV